MNKQRRKLINDNIKLLETAKNNLVIVLYDEENYFDNMPENLQGSLRGEESEEAIDVITEAIELLENCIDNLNEII